MYIVVYASSATREFSQVELEALLEKSRKSNEARNLTGMLLYKGGNFMQALEGAKDDVVMTLQKIAVDPRHHGVIRLIQRERPEREFEGWSMGFQRIDGDAAPPLARHDDFLDRPLNDTTFEKNPSRALRLLLSFKKVAK